MFLIKEEEEEMQKALAMSLQADSKMDVDPSLGGIPKQNKLTSPTDKKLDFDQRPKVKSPKSPSTVSPQKPVSKSSTTATAASRSAAKLGAPGTPTSSTGALGTVSKSTDQIFQRTPQRVQKQCCGSRQFCTGSGF